MGKKKATKKKATAKDAKKKVATKKKATKKKATKKKATKKKATKKKVTAKDAKGAKQKATRKAAPRKKVARKKATSGGGSPWGAEDPSILRKRRSEKWLARHGVPYIDHLPPIEDASEVSLRPPLEVAHRARLMFATAAIGYELEREEERHELLKSEGTWAYATRRERAFFAGRKRSQQAMIDATWILDAVWALLWALKAFDDLGLPERGRGPGEIQEYMPSLFDPAEEFFATHQELRPVDEILDATDLVYRLHWAARPWREPQVEWLCRSAVAERHKALNWLIGYGDAETWDEVTTDT